MPKKHSIMLPLAVLMLLVFGHTPGWAEQVNISGYLGLDSRVFLEDPAFSEQSNKPQFSLVVQPEFDYQKNKSAHQFKLIPFLRLDTVDDDRSHFDLREAYWRYTRDSWQILVGVNKVFWGVTESQHLVDIINQTDNFEDIDQEEKLGQPMVRLGMEKDWGEVALLIMPYFRERQYPGGSGRLRTPLPIVDDPIYESGAEEYHTDLALRYSHYFGDWDVGSYYFYGTSRDPVLIPDTAGERLTPFYNLIHQFGVDLQYTKEAWLWKFEGIVRDSRASTFAAAVGGFEYTNYQIFGTNADLGLLAEYNWDGRDETEEPLTLFDNDIFFGSRLALNDPQDSTALVGAIIDTENGSTIFSIEADRRIGDSWVVELIGRFFINIEETDPLQALEQDSFIDLSLQYYF